MDADLPGEEEPRPALVSWASRSTLNKAGWYLRHGYVTTAWLFARIAWEERRAR